LAAKTEKARLPTVVTSEIVGWHYKLIGIRGSKSQSGWHVGDPGEVG